MKIYCLEWYSNCSMVEQRETILISSDKDSLDLICSELEAKVNSECSGFSVNEYPFVEIMDLNEINEFVNSFDLSKYN